MVLQLEEAEAAWVAAGEAGQASPEVVEQRARRLEPIEAVLERGLQRSLLAAEHRVDQSLLARIPAVEGAGADLRRAEQIGNACSVKTPLGEGFEGVLEDPFVDERGGFSGGLGARSAAHAE